MKLFGKETRRWLCLLLALTMLLGHIPELPVFATDNEPPAAEEFVPEADVIEEEPVPGEPIPDEDEDTGTLSEDTEEPEIEQEPEEEPEETTEETAVDADAFRASVKELRLLLERWNAEGKDAEELTDELLSLMDEMMTLWQELCIAYYGSEDRIPFGGDDADDGQLSEMQLALTDEEREETEALLAEIFQFTHTASALETEQDDRTWFDLTEDRYGSGSYNLNENDNHHRFFLEYMVPTKTSAGIKRQNAFSVLVKKGEYLCFGSSIAGSTFRSDKADIVLKVGSTEEIYRNDKTTGQGYIKNRTQERNGPRLLYTEKNDASRYMPHIWKNNTNEDQIVTLTFFPQSATVKLGGFVEAGKDFENSQGQSTIAAWDITVVGKDTKGNDEVKPGRAWCKYLALTTNGNAVASADLELHVLTQDDYVYKVNLNQASPFGFIFFANNMGFTHSGNGYDQSIYHSFAANDLDLASMNTQGISVHNPSAPDSGHQFTHTVFFNEPSEDAKKALKVHRKVPEPITDLAFNGISDGVSQFTHGGDFTFNVSGATSVTLTIDFSAMLKAMGGSFVNGEYTGDDHHASFKAYMDLYRNADNTTYKPGMGVIQLSSAVSDGMNTIYWDGKDVNGHYLPVGYYAVQDQNTTAKIEVKVEAKAGEIHFPMTDVEGIFGGVTIERLGTNDEDRFDIYYNNTPLAQRRYIEQKTAIPSAAVAITHPKNGYGTNFFPITDHTYTYKTSNAQYFNIQGGILSTLTADGYTHNPINSKTTPKNMVFRASGNEGGGNNSGIDIWTYYAPHQTVECSLTTGFAIMDHPAVGTINGEIFYDVPGDSNEPNGKKDGSDYGISGLQVRLVNAEGHPVLHTVPLPIFDEYGNFMWDEEGNVLEEEKEIEFTAVTDAQGHYTFSGVYWGGDTEDDIGSSGSREMDYYVQVEMNAVQRETLKYICTTSRRVVDLKGWNYTIDSGCTGDGNEVVLKNDGSIDYVIDSDGYPKFVATGTQMIQITSTSDTNRSVTAKKIGYTSAIPKDNQRSYTIQKIWVDENDNTVTPSVDRIVVEMYYDDHVTKLPDHEGMGTNNRTGKLMETVILNKDNKWKYQWKVLDKTKDYYFVEYFYQLKSNHLAHIFGEDPNATGNGNQNTDGELSEKDHQILIGATGTIHSGDFKTSINWLPDAADMAEKQTTIDTESLLFNMDYSLTRDANDREYTVTLRNRQTYDERAFYIWAGKRTELPRFITRTHLDAVEWANGRVKYTSTEPTLTAGENNTIAGLKVEWVDGPGWAPKDGSNPDASEQFRLEDGKVYVTGVQEGQTVPKAGTYTFWATYNNQSWTMTFHVYDVQPDGIFHYSPLSKKEHVLVGTEEEADGELVHRDWLFHNDDYRIDLKHDAVDNSMGTCADLAGIFISEYGPKEVGQFTFLDVGAEGGTYSYPNNAADGVKIQIKITKSRNEHTNRDEDHVGFTSLSYQPIRSGGSSYFNKKLYVYYKYVVLSEKEVHDRNMGTLVNQMTDASRGVEMYTYFVLEPVVAELTGASLSVGDSVDLNFYMDEIVTTNSSGATGPTHPLSDYVMDFVLDGSSSNGVGTPGAYQQHDPSSNLTMERNDPVTNQPVQMFGYTFQDLNAYQMGESVIGRLWLKEEGTEEASEDGLILLDERSFSVRQYTKQMLADTTQRDGAEKVRIEALKEMLIDMVNYGTAAQRYAYQSGWISSIGTEANSVLTADLMDRYKNESIPDSVRWAESGEDEAKVTDITVTPVLQEGMQVGLRVCFTLADQNWEGYSVKIVLPDGREIAVPSSEFELKPNRQMVISAANIGTFYWNEPIKVQFLKASEVVYTLSYSVASYCFDMQESTDGLVADLARAMYRYGTSADVWRKHSTDWRDKIYGNPNGTANDAS